MKKYKTIDAMKFILENPKARLQWRWSDGCIWEMYNCHGGIRCIFGKGREIEQEDWLPLTVHNMKLEWTLIQQPISFMEAVKAYEKGKTIRCELEGKSYKYIFQAKSYKNKSPFFRGDADGYYMTTAEILDGKWYIEEDVIDVRD
ncbi:MAG TPA: hypothetical protein VMV86_04785 [Methanosarcinales archaeon]|nr:hypothetical protein [Methanosarcinales archaeon]